MNGRSNKQRIADAYRILGLIMLGIIVWSPMLWARIVAAVVWLATMAIGEKQIQSAEE